MLKPSLNSSLKKVRNTYHRVQLQRTYKALREGLGSTAFPSSGVTMVGHTIGASPNVAVTCRAGLLPVNFELASAAGTFRLSAAGGSDVAKRVLRNALIGTGRTVNNKGERTLLRTWPHGTAPRRLVAEAASAINSVLDTLALLPNETAPDRAVSGGHVLTYWWDTKANFGDTIGPWLVAKLTGRPVVNSRWATTDAGSLYTVGSVFGHLDRAGHEVWGTGLIGPLGQAKLERMQAAPPAKIHAVRGALTRRELTEKLGWDVPEVYGDPALLLPDYLSPSPTAASSGKIALVPHYKHKPEFAKLKGKGRYTVNVANGLEQVVDEIANARAVLSTSLHGIVIAQAYGVPWVWVRLEDNQLGGDAFKFEDFFTVLAREEVAEAHLSTASLDGLDLEALAGRATLPTSRFDAEKLRRAFPLPSAGADLS